jgi:hypothetical protein
MELPLWSITAGRCPPPALMQKVRVVVVMRSGARTTEWSQVAFDIREVLAGVWRCEWEIGAAGEAVRASPSFSYG